MKVRKGRGVEQGKEMWARIPSLGPIGHYKGRVLFTVPRDGGVQEFTVGVMFRVDPSPPPNARSPGKPSAPSWANGASRLAALGRRSWGHSLCGSPALLNPRATKCPMRQHGNVRPNLAYVRRPGVGLYTRVRKALSVADRYGRGRGPFIRRFSYPGVGYRRAEGNATGGS